MAIAPSCERASAQRGVATLEYAFMLLLGILPLVLFVANGTLVFAAKQSLSLAAQEGARAALRHGDAAQKKTQACAAARNAMAWLVNFSGVDADCGAPNAAPVQVSGPLPCTGGLAGYCMKVTVSYDAVTHPFMPGLGPLYGWVLDGPLHSEAVVHLDPSFVPTLP